MYTFPSDSGWFQAQKTIYVCSFFMKCLIFPNLPKNGIIGFEIAHSQNKINWFSSHLRLPSQNLGDKSSETKSSETRSSWDKSSETVLRQNYWDKRSETSSWFNKCWKCRFQALRKAKIANNTPWGGLTVHPRPLSCFYSLHALSARPPPQYFSPGFVVDIEKL